MFYKFNDKKNYSNKKQNKNFSKQKFHAKNVVTFLSALVDKTFSRLKMRSHSWRNYFENFMLPPAKKLRSN